MEGRGVVAFSPIEFYATNRGVEEPHTVCWEGTGKKGKKVCEAVAAAVADHFVCVEGRRGELLSGGNILGARPRSSVEAVRGLAAMGWGKSREDAKKQKEGSGQVKKKGGIWNGNGQRGLFFLHGKRGDGCWIEGGGWLVGWLVVFRRLFLGHFLLLRRVEVDGEEAEKKNGNGRQRLNMEKNGRDIEGIWRELRGMKLLEGRRGGQQKRSGGMMIFGERTHASRGGWHERLGQQREEGGGGKKNSGRGRNENEWRRGKSPKGIF
jgi:hypothetical protein